MAIQVTVIYLPSARQCIETELTLPDTSSVHDALQASGFMQRFPELEGAQVGVWGSKALATQVLYNLDRVEIYRPLQVDPKVARRTRFAKQGAKTAGLFAKKRAGAKAGY